MKLNIHNSKRKVAADDMMVSPGITDRFEKDDGFDEGDWGDVNKKFVPGPTYESEYDRKVAQMKAAVKRRDAEDAFRKKQKKPGLLKRIFGEEEMKDLLQSVISEAKEFGKQTKLPLTNCSVCGKNGQPVQESSPVEPKVVGHFIQTHLPSGKKHRGAMMDTHLRELGVNGRLSTGEKVTKDTILKHWNGSQPKTYKYEWDKETKESEIPGNDKAEICDECGKRHAPSVPCSAKKVLFGGESVVEDQKMSRQHDTLEGAEKHRASLEKSGVKAWVNKSPDNKHNVFWQMKESEINEVKKSKKWDKMAHVRAIARNVVGQVPKGQTIIPKKDRKPKYKLPDDE